jgi:hypothetical protein
MSDPVPSPPPLLEGYTSDELLALPDATLDAIALSGETLVFRVGSAEILGRFGIEADALVIELGHIDGGGEGALPTLSAVARRYARRRGLDAIEWRVHAVHCARPNLKLRRVLVRRGFEIREIPGVGECYWQRVRIKGTPAE